jgi:hypothetical protein
MNKYRLFITLLVIGLDFAACKSPMKPESLYGKWKYVKVENPNSHPPDSVHRYELEAEEAHIQFFKGDSLQIWWGRRVLSHGTFKIVGDDIRFKEILADGKTRDFPFWVSQLTNKDLVFETKGEDGSRVTAVRE